MMIKRWCVLTALSLALAACSEDSGGDGTAGAGGEGGMAGGEGGMAGGEGGAVGGAGAEGGMAGGAGGAGGMAGAGGEGGMAGGEGGAAGGMEPSIDERCPDAQIRTHLLVLFPDRVDAYFFDPGVGTASYFCKFLDLEGNGVTTATGMVQDGNGDFYVVASGESFGRVLKFSTNGEWIGEVERNINLAGVDGIWNTFSDDFVVWSAGNQNLYRLTEEGRFAGTWTPPAGQSARVPNLTDLTFVDDDKVVVTYSDREAKLFAPPFAPDFVEEEVGQRLGAAGAVVGVETDSGTQLLMTSQVGGLDGGFGVLLFRAVASGRAAPELQEILVQPAEILDGVDLQVTETGFLVLDSAIAGTPNLAVFNKDGDRLNDITVEGEGNPRQFEVLRVFRDF